MTICKVVTSVERRRYWNPREKCQIVQETYMPGVNVSQIARKYDISPSMLFNWRRSMESGGLQEVGLQNTLNGLEKFFEGKSDTTYWIGYNKDIPFAFLITSPEGADATTLDLFICDLNYLGKGIAVPMIKEFLKSQFSHVKRVLIDPEATNARAIHVYQKVGFKIAHEFIASWHPVPHYQMELLMKDLLPSIGDSHA